MKHIALTCIAAAALAGCVPPRVTPEVSRWYASRTFVADTQHRVGISAFSVPVPLPAGSAANISSLEGAGQAALVAAMAARTSTPASLSRALGTPIHSEDAPPIFEDRSVIRRQLVFSLERRSQVPDRISRARIRVLLPEGNQFVGWNRIENQYEMKELGSLSVTRTRGSSAELGLTLPVLGATPSVSSSAETMLQETQQLDWRIPVLLGALTAHEAVLLQEGAPGRDLTGNATANVEIALRRGGDAIVLTTSASPADPCREGPGLQTRIVRYAESSDSLKVDVVLNYDLRHVREGDTTEPEGDDSVEFAAGADTLHGVVVVTPEELRFGVYQLRLGNAVVQADSPEGSPVRGALEFAGYEDAAAFLGWLRRCGVRPPGLRLMAGLAPLTARSTDQVYVWLQPMNWQQGGGGAMPRPATVSQTASLERDLSVPGEDLSPRWW